MKKKISISIEEGTLEEIEKHLTNAVFRNKSHFIELGVQKLLDEIKLNQDKTAEEAGK